MRLPPALTRFSRNFFRSAFPTIWEPGFLEQGRSTSDSRRRTSVATSIVQQAREERGTTESLFSSPCLPPFASLSRFALNFVLFCFDKLFWTQACPEGMGTNGTHRSHARCHPYPIQQPVKVGHTTGVYVPYSFRTVVLRPTRTDQ